MVKVTLAYPYFQPSNDNSIFRFPPLGLGYVAASLRAHGVSFELVDCTFLNREEAVKKIISSHSQIVGIYSMFSMKKSSLELARAVRRFCDVLVVGGPLPTLDPAGYLEVFDVAVIGEGEKTMVELVDCVAAGLSFSGVKGIAYRDNGVVRFTAPRGFVENLDSLPFPARDLFDNKAYKAFYAKRFGYTTTPIITSRGCPFNCDFCSRPVFGASFRSRSPTNIVDEVEAVAGYGYDRVWFADDCFTLNREHLLRVCGEMVQRGVDMGWECLSRVDTMDGDVARRMRRAGCIRVFFGIESGNDQVLGLMNKRITVAQAERAVYTAKAAGLQVGAFFIVGYPGESDQTILDTVRFASGLPLDYLSFTLPYPIPGTALFERVKGNGGVFMDDWEEPKNWSLIRHKLLCGSNFSEAKLKFAIGKAQLQFYGRRFLGNRGYGVVGLPLERLTDAAFKLVR
ncbi:B12-binding domain-containing radical SAM protein [Candidatus Bathyarchaeota archaeon A05DMB-2]|jgi:anaerobic magnesium-protoporphyrin IX monomethyl ester cyclase|nr:B12-binding domain-containing radical SAM protein [Candidatus Bathyarchaeota archaeon A05DMB-2]